jgi:hypothetical protein
MLQLDEGLGPGLVENVDELSMPGKIPAGIERKLMLLGTPGRRVDTGELHNDETKAASRTIAIEGYIFRCDGPIDPAK